MVRIRPVPLPGVCPRSSYKIRRAFSEKVALFSRRRKMLEVISKKDICAIFRRDARSGASAGAKCAA